MRSPRPTRSILPALFLVAALAGVIRAADPPAESPKTDLVAGLEALTAKAKALAAEAAESFHAKPAPAPVFETTDAADDRVRFMILVPEGPLVVEASVTIDGRPFRSEREKMVDQLLAAADTDRDGKSTWQEAGKNQAFQVSGFSLARRSERRREEWIRRYDMNRDGVVDRPEVCTFIHQKSGLPAFSFFPTSDGDKFKQPDLSPILDADRDGVLSADELAEIPARLKRLDANDNDLIEPQEVVSANSTGGLAMAILAGETEALYQTVRTSSGDKPLSVERFPLLAPLDKNQNGLWDADESAGLLTMPAHVGLSVHFGKSKDKPAGLTLDALAPRWGDLARRVHKQRDGTVLEIPGARLDFRFEASEAYLNFDPAKILMEQLDGDTNGYLEKREVQESGYASIFRAWDQDGDGKVFLPEMKIYFDGLYAPQVSQLRVESVSLGAAIYGAIDTSRDGRLSLRELRKAIARIKEFDENRDGKVSLSEIPKATGISFARGLNYFDQRQSSDRAPEEEDAPRWFLNMDRNRDGDLTPREFLASAETFKKLDADGDGLVSQDEARAADEQARPRVEPQRQVQPSPQ